MFECDEMSQASQIISELDASNLATLKQIAMWSGLHENTVRDYRDGRIRHFGTETRFWNGVLNGLVREYHPATPPVCFRIVALMLRNTPFALTSVGVYGETQTPLPVILKGFIAIAKDVSEAAESVMAILDDGKVTRADDPNIDQLNEKLDRAMSWAMQIKHSIGKAREGAATR